MAWSLLVAGLVVVVLLAIGWWLSRRRRPVATDDLDGREGGPGGGSRTAIEPLALAFRGYRMDQVDDVLDRLEARVAEYDERIAALETSAGGPATVAADPDPPATATRSGPPRDEDGHSPEERPPPDPGPAAGRGADPVAGRPTPLRPEDLLAPALFLAVAAYLHIHLIAAPRTGYLSQGVQDQQLYEWFFGVTAHQLLTGSDLFFTTLQNYPLGVNLMANTAFFGLGIPLVPVTLLAGPSATFLVVQVLGMALAASAWYWVFRRHLAVHPVAAFLGATFAGFAPGLVSHANGHANFVATFLIPVIIDRLLRLATDGRPARDGVVLGLLVTWQVFLGEEVLLLAALGMLVGGAVLVAHRRLDVRRMLPGVGIGALVALVLLAYPLWWQFTGPQSYASIWHPPAGNDLAQLWSRATRSLGADPWVAAELSMNRTEENSFFGVPLWIAVLATTGFLWRSVVVRSLAVVVVVSCWLSLGAEPTLHGSPLGVPGPWALFEHVPVVDNILPTRFALVAVPALGALLSLGVDALRRVVDRAAEVPGAGMAAAVAAAAVALVPVVPTPLVVDPRPTVPDFFTDGTWRDYVDEGGSLLAAPPPNVGDARALEWQETADFGFPVVGGYFVGPDGSPEGVGVYGAAGTPLLDWLHRVAEADVVDTPTPELAARYAAELREADVDVIVLPEGRPSAGSLLASISAAFGSPEEVDGVYVWDVREVTDGAG